MDLSYGYGYDSISQLLLLISNTFHRPMDGKKISGNTTMRQACDPTH
jgi:hypothetical protein